MRLLGPSLHSDRLAGQARPTSLDGTAPGGLGRETCSFGTGTLVTRLRWPMPPHPVASPA
eukprot:8189597-Alexandrium_andersonii.AAC.1